MGEDNDELKGGAAGPSSSAGMPVVAASKSGNHGAGFCTAAWCQIATEDGSRPAWHAITVGQDGKLTLRKGDESLATVRVSGDHEKAACCVAVSDDGKTVASVEGNYVQVRSLACAAALLPLCSGRLIA
jgi:hypothetical protein